MWRGALCQMSSSCPTQRHISRFVHEPCYPYNTAHVRCLYHDETDGQKATPKTVCQLQLEGWPAAAINTLDNESAQYLNDHSGHPAIAVQVTSLRWLHRDVIRVWEGAACEHMRE